MSTKLHEEYSKLGLTIHWSKTKHMCLGGNNRYIDLDRGITIKACGNFIYLGFKVDHVVEYKEMITARV